MDPKSQQRIIKAKALFSGPYNCSQSVAAAFSDILDKDDDEIFRLMSGFGFGMGGQQAVCGAVSGGTFVLSSRVEDPARREELYDKVYYLINRIKEQNQGKLHCLDLVGENPGSEEFNTVCPLLIEQVVKEVSKIINSEQ
jgi:C_GCAxxG_C_C family probable redox protein